MTACHEGNVKGFVSAIKRGQTGYSAPYVSGQTCFGTPRFSLTNEVKHVPPPSPPAGSNPLRPSDCVRRTHFRAYLRLQPLECATQTVLLLTGSKPPYDHLSPILHICCVSAFVGKGYVHVSACGTLGLMRKHSGC